VGELLNPASGIRDDVESLAPDELIRFVKSVFRRDARGWLGAKVHTHQLYELPISLSVLLECAVRPRVIVLYRESLLDTYVSLEIALRNGVWYSTDSVNTEAVFVDWKQFLAYSERERARWTESMEALTTCGCESLVLSFERLVANTQPVMDEVFHFFGLGSVAVETDSVRQNPHSLAQKVLNWCDLPATKNGAACRLSLLVPSGVASQGATGLWLTGARQMPE
jgi:hypothetical protein